MAVVGFQKPLLDKVLSCIVHSGYTSAYAMDQDYFPCHCTEYHIPLLRHATDLITTMRDPYLIAASWATRDPGDPWDELYKMFVVWRDEILPKATTILEMDDLIGRSRNTWRGRDASRRDLAPNAISDVRFAYQRRDWTTYFESVDKTFIELVFATISPMPFEQIH